MSDDFYTLLDVPEDASQGEIRDAFRDKVQKYHPDHNDDPRANAQFTTLKKAYDTLGDETERRAYDRLGHEQYVSERLDGLPHPNQWPSVTGEDDGGSGSSGRRSGSSGSTTGAGTAGRSSTRHDGQSGRAGTASSGAGHRGRTSTDGGGTRSASAHGRRTTTTSAESSWLADVDRRVTQWVSQSPLMQRLIGWPLVYFSVAVYLAGLGTYALDQRSAIGTVVEDLQATGLDVGGLLAILDGRGELASVTTYLVDGLLAGSPLAVLLAFGLFFYPSVLFVLVHFTRMTPGWRPTYLYVVAACAPLFAVFASVFAGNTLDTLTIAGDLAFFLLFPMGVFVLMLLSANVRPVVLQWLGRDPRG